MPLVNKVVEPSEHGHTATLFSPLRLDPALLHNRAAVAPMTRVSASADGHPLPEWPTTIEPLPKAGSP